jgi:hypothetical protein
MNGQGEIKSWEEDGAGKTAGSTRQDQGISITPLAALQSASLQEKLPALAHIDKGFLQKQLPQDIVESFWKKSIF